MHIDPPCDMDFFDWLDTLDDEQHHAVYVAMCELVDELGVCVTQQPQGAQNLFQLLARVNPHFSLN